MKSTKEFSRAYSLPRLESEMHGKCAAASNRLNVS